jgi:hypothetical protein
MRPTSSQRRANWHSSRPKLLSVRHQNLLAFHVREELRTSRDPSSSGPVLGGHLDSDDRTRLSAGSKAYEPLHSGQNLISTKKVLTIGGPVRTVSGWLAQTFAVRLLIRRHHAVSQCVVASCHERALHCGRRQFCSVCCRSQWQQQPSPMPTAITTTRSCRTTCASTTA